MIIKVVLPPSRKVRIEEAFSGAASSYDGAAEAQRHVARRLAERVLSAPPPQGARILEVGCGTGLLTREIVPALSDRDWLVTDLAQPMLDRCRSTVGEGPAYRLMDGEYPDVEAGSQDLIVSSLAFQWFDDLASGLERLAACLRPGGRMLFSMVGSETFHEWRTWLDGRVGPRANALGTQPDAAQLSRLVKVVGEERIPLDYASGGAFLRHLKELGAGVAAAGYKPLPPRLLRDALRDFDGRITYHVLYGEVRR